MGDEARYKLMEIRWAYYNEIDYNNNTFLTIRRPEMNENLFV